MHISSIATLKNDTTGFRLQATEEIHITKTVYISHTHIQKPLSKNNKKLWEVGETTMKVSVSRVAKI